MAVTLINGDGNQAVYASQDADWYAALTNQTTCIMNINDNLAYTVADSNTIEIGSGVCITKEGRRVQINEGDICEIVIPTGTQGVDTYYIIGFHLYIDDLGAQVAETFCETMDSSTSTITETTFKEGSTSIYISLYRVKRSGLTLESVTQIIPTYELSASDITYDNTSSGLSATNVQDAITELNTDLTGKTVELFPYSKTLSDGSVLTIYQLVINSKYVIMVASTYIATNAVASSINFDTVVTNYLPSSDQVFGLGYNTSSSNGSMLALRTSGRVSAFYVPVGNYSTTYIYEV